MLLNFSVKPLKGVRIVSLALNLPGPAALWRLRAMGARCTKVDPPAGDPMRLYSPAAFADLSAGLKAVTLDLKAADGQAKLHKLLAQADVLLTSFRPSALAKLGLDGKSLKRAHPALSLVTIVGAPGERAEEPGHDLTYQAEVGLVADLAVPPSLLADMAGALAASEAVLQAVLAQRASGKGVRLEVALSEAARWLALPRQWGLTAPGQLLGGAHAGYRVYPCKNGRVALAALEPHFAAGLGQAFGLGPLTPEACLLPATHQAVAAFVAGKTRAQLDKLAAAHDLPLLTLPA
jgi:crotonobetainyl-CoA:carnitine CoA-transferase CaiB-like acyl-CoA transferase